MPYTLQQLMQWVVQKKLPREKSGVARNRGLDVLGTTVDNMWWYVFDVVRHLGKGLSRAARGSGEGNGEGPNWESGKKVKREVVGWCMYEVMMEKCRDVGDDGGG